MRGLKVLSIVAIGSSVVFFGFGCKETQSPENKAGKNVLFDLQVGEISIQTELALLPEERRKVLCIGIVWMRERVCFSFSKKPLPNVFG